jgi:hypothetical protein
VATVEKTDEVMPLQAEPVKSDAVKDVALEPMAGSLPVQAVSPNPVISTQHLSRVQLITELVGLRQLEQKNREELRRGSSRDLDIVAAEIEEIKFLKGEIKRRLRQL